MDFRQWRSNHQKQSYHSLADSTPLPLYAPEPNKNSTITTAASQAMSAFTESTPSRLPWLGGYFSLAQWQELELQALIYKYIMAGASVPLELILPLKRNLLNASAYYHHQSQQYQHFQPSTLQSGYWGRYAIDPEPGRCRRTDGKKWRCSRDVVSGQKYCERHVHRGRNRSRKLVEEPKSIQSSGLNATALPSPFLMIKDTHLTRSKASPALTSLPHNQRPPEETSINGYLEGSFCSNLTAKELQGEKPDGRLLRRFFDDWPRSEQDSSIKGSNMSTEAAVTNLSISIPGNCSSDFSLKLSTGICSSNFHDKNADGRVLLLTENLSSWGSQGEASMGGPLAEALRSSSASTPSPTSVLCKPCGSMSETSSIST